MKHIYLSYLLYTFTLLGMALHHITLQGKLSNHDYHVIVHQLPSDTPLNTHLLLSHDKILRHAMWSSALQRSFNLFIIFIMLYKLIRRGFS